jgi:hypothetical protein
MTLQINELTDEESQMLQSTFIFFSTKKKLTISQLRKDFLIKNGSLIKITRKDYWRAMQVERLYAVMAADLKNEDEFYNFSNQKKLTHILITPFQTCTKSIGLIKYTNEIIGGLDISNKDLESVENLFSKYQSCVNSVISKNNLTSAMKKIMQSLLNERIANEPFPKEVADQFFDSLNNYLDPLLANAHQAIVDWHEEHRWRDVSEINQHAATLEIPENKVRALLAA